MFGSQGKGCVSVIKSVISPRRLDFFVLYIFLKYLLSFILNFLPLKISRFCLLLFKKIVALVVEF